MTAGPKVITLKKADPAPEIISLKKKHVRFLAL